MKRLIIIPLAIGFISVIGSGAIQGQQDQVRINEFLAINETSLEDQDGEFPDWIEIYNHGTETVSLGGWALTDDQTEPEKWIFPEVNLDPNGFLVVFASGKNRADPGNELHTSFKISGGGEYLALLSPTGEAVTEFAPVFPSQQADVSFGFLSGSFVYFSQPTPGAENTGTGFILPAPTLSIPHGIYEESFEVEISADFPHAEVYYTLDGGTPTNEFGTLYSGPVHIDTTTILRARAVLNDTGFSITATSSYIFLEDVIRQSNHPEGYPPQWGPYTAIEGTATADYEMDPEMMADPTFAASVLEGLKSIPTVSLVTDREYLFSHSTDPETGGIYIYTGPPTSRTSDGLGKGWERPASVEYFTTDGTQSFQVNCGLRIQGGHSRRPEKSPKHSFRLVFRSEYGPARLNFPLFHDEEAETSFNNLILRAGFGLSWIHHSHVEREQAQYQRDVWIKDTQRALDHPSSHSEYVHLYLNGMYWGIYAPSERMDKDFAASYLEGEPEEFDVIKDYQDVADGSIDAWNRLIEMANAGLADQESYQRIQGNNPDGSQNPGFENLVDVESLTDYMLINFYGGNTDWDHHNWTAIRNRVNPGEGFKFFCWDSEHILKTLNHNVLDEDNDNCPSRVFQQARENEAFRVLFADRVQELCFQGGPLTPEAAAERWEQRTRQVEAAIPAEAARWGDYRRDVHQFQVVGPFDLYDYQQYWIPQHSFMLNGYFPERTSVFLNQLRMAGLFPFLDAPEFFINGEPYPFEEVNKGDMLSMSSDEGIIYYTTNGSDPADWDSGEISDRASIYTGAIPMDYSNHVVARTFLNGEWSAAMRSFIYFPEDLEDIRITEIHYSPLPADPVPGSDFEFIELKNIGPSTLKLDGVRFVEGIQYTFPPKKELTPGGFVVLSSSEWDFFDRYGFLPDGQYEGNLNNTGEWIRLEDPEGNIIFRILYDDAPPWPDRADGLGYSLVPVDFNPPGEQGGPQKWRSSHFIGGSPGRDDSETTGIPVPGTQLAGPVLEQNYPNPFDELTYISYTLPEDAEIEISIFNVTGQKVAELVTGYELSGTHVVSWNGVDRAGRILNRGIYFYRLVVSGTDGPITITRKLIMF